MADSTPEPTAPDTPPSSFMPDALAAMTPEERGQWRLTGKVPEKAAAPTETDESEQSGAQDEVVPSSPASADADKPHKPRHDTKLRFADLTKQRDAERARADAAELRARELEARLNPQASAKSDEPAPAAATVPPTAKKPVLDDFLNEPDPYAALSEAIADWKVEQRLASYESQQQERAARHQQAQRDKEAADRGREKYPDWDESLNGDFAKTFVPPPHLWQAIVRSESSEDLIYFLSKHPDEARKLAAIKDPIAAALEVGKLSVAARPSHNGSTPAKTKSSAPEPPLTLGTKPTVSGDELDQALKAGDVRRYREIANARALAAKAQGR